MFEKILVANRGEIAVRIIRTCREMGIKSVAVYSDADRDSLHRMYADESVHIGESAPSESYLSGDRIIDAAKRTGAQAIHPGYGFLAENAEFAQLCEDSGIVFIGPPPKVISDLGDKTVARRIMAQGGVPVTPGIDEEGLDPGRLAGRAEEIGFPLLVKASCGGGGKGMRVVRSADELSEALASASSEARAAFGNGSVYLERYIERPRHVEVQILADAFGNTVHLFERECSIQRRHQKIVEETPSPALDTGLRAEICDAAVRAAKAAEYVNAGTVEFLLDESGNFYFLEVNTRLQVEHPVTEMITGVDIVRKQIEIAAGKELALSQEEVRARGHAIECRIYAEDPANGFAPAPGRIACLRPPEGPGIRHDCGVYAGFTVPVEYDPILAKLVVHAENRNAAIDRMKDALSSYLLAGVGTAVPFLRDIIDSAPFRAGQTFTDFIETHFPDWRPLAPDIDIAALGWVACEIWGRRAEATDGGQRSTEIPTPWETLGHWRL